MKQFTFSVVVTSKISRSKAERLLEAIVILFELAGFKLSVDFTAGFNLTK